MLNTFLRSHSLLNLAFSKDSVLTAPKMLESGLTQIPYVTGLSLDSDLI